MSGKQRGKSATILLCGVCLGAVSTLAGLYLFGYRFNPLLRTPEFRKFLSSYTDIVNEYVQKEPQGQLIDGAISGMVQTLNDPFTDYFKPSQASQFKTFLSGNYVGIGVTIASQGSSTVVHSTIPGAPAAEAGLKDGDILRTIGSKSVVGKSLSQISTLIQGPVGSTVAVTILRGHETLTFHVKRAEVQAPNVTERVVASNIGYLSIAGVNADSAKQVASAISTLQKDHVRGYIVDVRGNPGGYLDQVIQIASEFVPKGKVVVSTMDRDGSKQSYDSTGPGTKLPIAVLIDGNTASAAEVLAAALRDDDGAALVGVKSYGKGTVQTTVYFNDGSALKYTIQKWLTPKGAWIHHKGLSPKIDVTNAKANVDSQLAAAIETVKSDISR